MSEQVHGYPGPVVDSRVRGSDPSHTTHHVFHPTVDVVCDSLDAAFGGHDWDMSDEAVHPASMYLGSFRGERLRNKCCHEARVGNHIGDRVPSAPRLVNGQSARRMRGAKHYCIGHEVRGGPLSEDLVASGRRGSSGHVE